MSRLRRLNLLLVEDNPGDAALVKLELASSLRPIFHVTHVETLAAAGAFLSTGSVDVILLDLSLPDSAGMETVARMQAMAPCVAIVVLTGLDDPDFADRVLEAGAQDYLTKTMEMGGLLHRSIRYALTRMAAQLERQELLDRLTREQERLREELAGALQMQLALLPSAATLDDLFRRHGLRLEGMMEPSSTLGGDAWGCFSITETRLGLFIFDIAGHGISAALNAFRLHALIEDHDQSRDDPAVFLQKLNLALRPLLPRGCYSTMFYGVIDTASHCLTWAGAAAPPPILVRNGDATLLDTRGLPLGLHERAQYRNRVCPFLPGDNLFLYSDAMTEAACPPEEGFFGEENLANLVARVLGAGQTSSAALSTLVCQFMERITPPLADDLTAVLVQRETLITGTAV